MKKIYDKIKNFDENGHFVLVMKGSGGKSLAGVPYYVNNKSEYCPEGSGDEEFIKYIFSGDDAGLKGYYEAIFNREYDISLG